MEILKYEINLKKSWDTFIDESDVSSFLLKRDFIEYHSHIYEECSLLVKNGEELILIIPACRIGDKFSSFHFLTYGGFILPRKNHDIQILKSVFVEVIKFIKEELNLKYIVVKRIPFFYYKNPNEDDLFFFTQLDFKVIYKDLSSVMKIDYDLFPQKKSYNHRKAIRDGLIMSISNTSERILDMMNTNLKKYGKQAVHNFSELDDLKVKFQKEIMFFEVREDKSDLLYGGCVLFIVNKAVHIQYMASTDLGRKKRVVDFIIGELLNIYVDYDYLDYGISTESQGSYLNSSLFNAKRELGFGSACYEIYEKEIK